MRPSLCPAPTAKPGNYHLARLNFRLRTSIRKRRNMLPSNETKKNLPANTQSGKGVYESINVARKIRFVKIPWQWSLSEWKRSCDTCSTISVTWRYNLSWAMGNRKFPMKQHRIIQCWKSFPSVALWMNSLLHPKKDFLICPLQLFPFIMLPPSPSITGIPGLTWPLPMLP